MTLTTPTTSTSHDTPRISVTISWRCVQPGLWVGTRNGEFAGMIEGSRGEGFSAMTGLGKTIGSFPTMDAARASFTD